MRKNTAYLIMAALIVFACITIMAGCNYTPVDLKYSFAKAMIRLPNGDIVEGSLDSWRDYEGDQLQVKIDGVTYLVHSNNCVLYD